MVRTMPDIVWAASWALLGLLLAAYAARRAWIQHRISRRELAAVRRYEELREGDYAAIEGTVEKIGRGDFDLVMEGRSIVRIRPQLRAKVDEDIWRRAEEIVAEEAERPVHVSGIVERAPRGFALRVVPYRRMIVSTVPLWRRAARQRLAHVLAAFVAMGLSLTLFRLLAWDALRLSLEGTVVRATLSNLRDFDEESFRFLDLGYRKVRRTRLDAAYVDDEGRTRRFSTLVEPDTEWLWSLRADQDEVRRLGIEPVVQPFVILAADPSVHQLGDRVHMHLGAALGPLAFFALAGILYRLFVVVPELPPRHRNPRHGIFTPPRPAA